MKNHLNTNIKSITIETLMRALDFSTDEIYIIDCNHKIIYVNKACERHYGISPSKIIGKNNMEMFQEGYWSPIITPRVFEEKKPIHTLQDTYLGAKLMTTAIPITENGEVEYVIFISKENHHYNLMKKFTSSQHQSEGSYTKPKFIINSTKMQDILYLCQKIAEFDSMVLMTGDSGTGKSILANYVHEISKRTGPFITVNCSSIPENLLESELFGYEPGAFTGAKTEGQKGLIEQADQGTLFLDEIGDLSLHLQPKILRFLQDKKITPVGSIKVKKVNTRIITATNQNLEEMVRQKQFREDLYYRINVINIELPPLRKRQEDMIPLIYYFLYKFNDIHGLNKAINEDCMNLLTAYEWPGNIRQLENTIERLVITSDNVIQLSDVPEFIRYDKTIFNTSNLFENDLDTSIEHLEKEMVRSSFLKHKSTRKVGEDIGVSQTRASNLIRKHCDDLR